MLTGVKKQAKDQIFNGFFCSLNNSKWLEERLSLDSTFAIPVRLCLANCFKTASRETTSSIKTCHRSDLKSHVQHWRNFAPCLSRARSPKTSTSNHRTIFGVYMTYEAGFLNDIFYELFPKNDLFLLYEESGSPSA